LISAFGGGVDGRRSLTHCSLIRHYLYHCGTWKSSYRLVMGLLQEIDVEPLFDPRVLVQAPGVDATETTDEAIWDVVLVRLSALQEYGWHAGIESLMWASDTVNGSLVDFDWARLRVELAEQRQHWTQMIIDHARSHHEYFPPPTEYETDWEDHSE
jgi:hypothetical protein